MCVYIYIYIYLYITLSLSLYIYIYICMYIRMNAGKALAILAPLQLGRLVDSLGSGVEALQNECLTECF